VMGLTSAINKSIDITRYHAAPALGRQTVTALDRNSSGATLTFTGTEANMLLTAEWMG